MRRLPLVLLPLALAACGGSSDSNDPNPPNASAFTHLAAGWGMTCGLDDTGKAYCWGSNGNGELGIGEGVAGFAATPTAVAGGRTYTQITAGFDHVCALDAAGAAWCWGENFLGSVGNGTFSEGVFAPAQVLGGHTFVEIKAAGYSTCGRTAAGAAWCWGRNRDGELGDGTSGVLGDGSSNKSNVPVQVIGGLSFATLGRGSYHTCGITTAGDAYCWGRNAGGPLGTGTEDDATGGPVAVSGGLKFASIAGGQSHPCALTTTGTAYCWGSNDFGGLGDGTTTARLVPTAVSGNLAFTRISLASYHSCGSVGSGAVHCWGRNANGELGDGTTTDRSLPTLVLGDRGLVSVFLGVTHTCGLTSAGVAWCWGENEEAQLGIGVSTGPDQTVPVMVEMPE